MERTREQLIALRDAVNDAIDEASPDLAGIIRELAEVVQVSAGDLPTARREFMGCRRWVADRAAEHGAKAESLANTASYRDYRLRAEECEHIAKAMGDYWLGPEGA